MKAGLHVLTEKLMGHSVHECKEMARVADETKLAPGHRPPAPLQHPLPRGDGHDPARRAGRSALHPGAVAPRQSARQRQLATAAAAGGQEGRQAGRGDGQEAEELGEGARRGVGPFDRRLAEAGRATQGPTGRQDGQGREVRLQAGRHRRRRRQDALSRAADRGADPLAAVGPHRRRLDGRVGLPSTRRREHLHLGHARAARSSTR